MRLRIIETNFTTEHDWLFKLANEKGDTFYIMNELFYLNRNLESPISKKELDYYDKGLWIQVRVESVDGKNVVVK